MNRDINYKSFPWLFFISSIIVPISSLANGVDIFYCGLLLSSLLNFVSSLLVASLTSLSIAVINYRLRTKLIISILALISAVSVINLIEMVISGQKLIIEATVNTCQPNEDKSFFLVGCLLGSPIGLGTGFWMRNLIRSGLSKWTVILVPLLANVSVLAASIGIFLQGITYGSFLLFVIGVILPVAMYSTIRRC